MKNWIFFLPLDTWSFRDGRPFDAGEAFDAESLFPPPPWTVSGAIRTALLRRLCPQPERYAGWKTDGTCEKCDAGPCKAEKEIGPADTPPPFALGPPLLCQWNNGSNPHLYFPVPADLVSEEGKKPLLLNPIPLAGNKAMTSLPESLLPVGFRGDTRLEPFQAKGLSTTELEQYLRGIPPERGLQDNPAINETRIGIGMDYFSGTARERQLYIRDTVCLKEGWGLGVSTDKDLELDGEIVRLGGDGRMARLHSYSGNLYPSAPSEVKNCFRLYLASPAPLEEGWRPQWIDSKSLCGQVPGTQVEVKLQAVALAGPVSLGGWNLAKQQPRDMRKMAGAGTVYYFNVKSGNAEEAVAALHGKSLIPESEEGRIGFGLAFAGGY